MTHLEELNNCSHVNFVRRKAFKKQTVNLYEPITGGIFFNK